MPSCAHILTPRRGASEGFQHAQSDRSGLPAPTTGTVAPPSRRRAKRRACARRFQGSYLGSAAGGHRSARGQTMPRPFGVLSTLRTRCARARRAVPVDRVPDRLGRPGSKSAGNWQNCSFIGRGDSCWRGSRWLSGGYHSAGAVEDAEIGDRLPGSRSAITRWRQVSETRERFASAVSVSAL